MHQPIIDSGTLWKRKNGYFTHLTYEVIAVGTNSVSYRAHDKQFNQRALQRDIDEWHRDFRQLTADEVLIECPIL